MVPRAQWWVRLWLEGSSTRGFDGVKEWGVVCILIVMVVTQTYTYIC